MIGAVLFTWLQGAGFYRDLHAAAVARLPPGLDRSWLDLGCGPGLVARLAAERGYDATGVDTDVSMIRAAKRLARWHGSSANFVVGDLSVVADKRYQVISAASLLAVLDDKEEALHRIWEGVSPGGYLLVIEPTDRMNPENAGKLIDAGLAGKRVHGLAIWARARENRATDPAMLAGLQSSERRTLSFLQGMVEAHLLRKPHSSRIG